VCGVEAFKNSKAKAGRLCALFIHISFVRPWDHELRALGSPYRCPKHSAETLWLLLLLLRLKNMEFLPEKMLSEEIVNAQKEAEYEADALEAEDVATDSTAAVGTAPDDEIKMDEALPEVPKLLHLPQSTLVQKTHEFKQKGKQLDLLLLKAETYSHFIKENQARSQIRLGQQQQQTAAAVSTSTTPSKDASDSGKKKRKSPSQAMASPSKRPTSGSSPALVLPEENLAEGLNDAILIQQPSNLEYGKLLPYQLEGVQWLLSLWENGLSGILADEMGLGKTIQIIALVAHLRLHSTAGPFLIVAPLATIPNWINEFKRWLPSCPVVLYHGSKEHRDAIRKARMSISLQKEMHFPVVVTSFEICMIDRKYLERYTWQVSRCLV
jgi:SNF2 family DNA or RNA helicase